MVNDTEAYRWFAQSDFSKPSLIYKTQILRSLRMSFKVLKPIEKA